MADVDEIGRQLKAFIDSFDFERPGVDGSIGRDCAHAVAEAIAETGAVQHTTDGEAFPANEPRYAEWKDRKYNVAAPGYGIRTGQMLSLESLRGDIEVEPQAVTMKYGTGRPPTRSAASGFISESDRSITDRRKADYNSPKMNNFYKLGWYGRRRVKEVIREAMARAIQEENNR